MVFRDAGHILGSASVHFEINENGKVYKIGFTGDIGRPNMPLTHDPNVLRELDLLVMESTYGNRLHSSYENVEQEVADIICQTSAAGGKVIIPSFAVGRTQILVYVLHKLFNQGRVPDLPVYVDSPLACDATNIFRSYPEYLDRETNRVFLKYNEDPFGFGRLTYVHDVEGSKKLNNLAFPHVIISGSGMAEGGRILHHLRNNIDNPKILFSSLVTQLRKLLPEKLWMVIIRSKFSVKNIRYVQNQGTRCFQCSCRQTKPA